MRTAIIAFASISVVVVAAASAAQTTRDLIPPLLDDICNSAAQSYGTMTIDVDIVENDTPTEAGEASVFYSNDGQATWNEAELYEVPSYTGGTWGTSFDVGDQPVRYYFVVHDDSSATFSSPVNSGDAFPPPKNLMANPGTEVGGDIDNPRDWALDLDGFWVGYSDTHLYATLSNVTGSWPTADTIFGPWFIYSLVVDNPDAGADSFAYALVYGSVPLIAASGLYFVDARDTSYTRIGDIETQISDGDLNMRCDLTDLYDAPHFGPDNPSGYYHLGVGTATVWLANLGNAADSSYLNAYYHRTDVGALDTNTPAQLSAAGYEFSTEQGLNGAVVTLNATYTDADGHLPTVRRAFVDGSPVDMGSGADHDYSSGVEFTVDVDVTLEDHVFYFSFSDGLATVETAPDTIPLGSGVPGGPPATEVAVRSVWPSPARNQASVHFSLPAESRGNVSIYDVSGRLVRDLWSGPGGERSCVWDGTDGSGAPMPSGVYFVRLASPSGTDRAKLVLLR